MYLSRELIFVTVVFISYRHKYIYKGNGIMKFDLIKLLKLMIYKNTQMMVCSVLDLNNYRV